MYNYKLKLAYDGTRYNGWQRQGNTENTIQGKLNEIISKYTGEEVDIAGSGRTDAGVHAQAQMASFKTEKELDTKVFLEEVNGYLPHDIRILEIKSVDERFHARLNAKRKVYTYIIDNTKVGDVFLRKYSYRVEERLNIELMKEASKNLLGTHDFTSFCNNKHMKKSAERTIDSIEITDEKNIIKIAYTGDGFLFNMVRLMTGVLVEAGLGVKKPEEIIDILEKKDRKFAGHLAPPEGLFLTEVRY